MRPVVREFVEICTSVLSLQEPIYEFGSFLVDGQTNYANLRTLFSGKKYMGCDMRPGPGVDLVLNLHDIDLPDNTAGTVLCLETLEHVEFPHRAIQEIHRILAPGGIAIISSVMIFPIHDYPHDYWRFTPFGFKSILAPFQNSLVEAAGHNKFPHTIVGIGLKGDIADSTIEETAKRLQPWKARWKDPSNNGFEKTIKKLFNFVGLDAHRKYPE